MNTFSPCSLWYTLLTDLWQFWSEWVQTEGRLLLCFWPESWSSRWCRGSDPLSGGSTDHLQSLPSPSHLLAYSYPVCSKECSLSEKVVIMWMTVRRHGAEWCSDTITEINKWLIKYIYTKYNNKGQMTNHSSLVKTVH